MKKLYGASHAHHQHVVSCSPAFFFSHCLPHGWVRQQPVTAQICIPPLLSFDLRDQLSERRRPDWVTACEWFLVFATKTQQTCGCSSQWHHCAKPRYISYLMFRRHLFHFTPWWSQYIASPSIPTGLLSSRWNKPHNCTHLQIRFDTCSVLMCWMLTRVNVVGF